MEIIFLPKAKDHLSLLQKSGNTTILKKITQLLRDIQTNPYSGIGKPEPLKYELAGLYSRRINKEHRLIYEIDNDIIYIFSCLGHYK